MEELPLDEVHIEELLTALTEGGYSELYLEIGHPPRARRPGSGTLNRLWDEDSQYEAARPETARRLVYDILSESQIRELEKRESLLFTYTSHELVTFHVHVLHAGGNVQATFLILPGTIV